MCPHVRKFPNVAFPRPCFCPCLFDWLITFQAKKAVLLLLRYYMVLSLPVAYLGPQGWSPGWAQSRGHSSIDILSVVNARRQTKRMRVVVFVKFQWSVSRCVHRPGGWAVPGCVYESSCLNGPSQKVNGPGQDGPDNSGPGKGLVWCFWVH